MGPVVQDVAKVGVKRVNVVKAWELVQHARQLVVPGLLGELDLSHVELLHPVDAPPRVTLGRRFALRAGQDNKVDEVLRRGHWRDPFEVVQRHVSSCLGVRFVFFFLSSWPRSEAGPEARAKAEASSTPSLALWALWAMREKVAKMFPPFLRCVHANTSLSVWRTRTVSSLRSKGIVIGPSYLHSWRLHAFLTALSAIQSSIRLDYEHWYLDGLFDRMMLRPCYSGGNSLLSVLRA